MGTIVIHSTEQLWYKLHFYHAVFIVAHYVPTGEGGGNSSTEIGWHVHEFCVWLRFTTTSSCLLWLAMAITGKIRRSGAAKKASRSRSRSSSGARKAKAKSLTRRSRSRPSSRSRSKTARSRSRSMTFRRPSARYSVITFSQQLLSLWRCTVVRPCATRKCGWLGSFRYINYHYRPTTLWK